MEKKPKRTDKKTSVTGNVKELRRQAEERLATGSKVQDAGELRDTKVLLHELYVHQIELELQNQELMNARQEAEEARDKYYDLYDFAPAAYLTLDEKARILEINFTGSRLLGTDRSKLTGRYMQLFIDHGDVPVFNGLLRDIIAGEEKANCEISLAADGIPSARVRVEGTLSRFAAGAAPQCRIIMVDITERRKAQIELRRKSEQLTLAQQAAGAGFWDWDIPANTQQWSDELFRLFGLDPAITTASFDTWLNIIHPDDRVIAREHIDAAIRDHLQMNNEYRILLRNGETRWINALGNTTYDSQGLVPLRMMGICLDITARKNFEKELFARSDELERFNRAAVNRELRMIDLKKEVNELCARAGEPRRYNVDFTDDPDDTTG